MPQEMNYLPDVMVNKHIVRMLLFVFFYKPKQLSHNSSYGGMIIQTPFAGARVLFLQMKTRALSATSRSSYGAEEKTI